MFVYPLSAKPEESLRTMVVGRATDKNTDHSYIDNLYSSLFTPIRHSVKAVLEIGVDAGGSVRLWQDFFVSANIYGIDVNPHAQINDAPRIRTWLMNAYSAEAAATIPEQLDIIIDDGPHTLVSILELFKYYPQKLKAGGLLIVEDVQTLDWFPTLIAELPADIVRDTLVYDMREVRPRYDDVALVWRKPNNQI